MQALREPDATVSEASMVVFVCFGLFIASSIAAVATDFPAGDGFTDGSFLVTMAVELVLGTVALLLLRKRGYPIFRLLPQPTWLGCGLGALLSVAAVAAWNLVAMLLFRNADMMAQPIVEMTHRSAISLPILLATSLVNGLYEEMFLCGYLIRGFARFGGSTAIGISILVRMLYHLYQGPVGAVSMVIYGAMSGVLYWRTRNLWALVFAHAMTDVLAFL